MVFLVRPWRSRRNEDLCVDMQRKEWGGKRIAGHFAKKEGVWKYRKNNE